MDVAALKAAWGGGHVASGSVVAALQALCENDALARAVIGALMGALRSNRAAILTEVGAFARPALAAMAAAPQDAASWRPAARVVQRLVDDVLTRRALLSAGEELWWEIWSAAAATMAAAPVASLHVDDAMLVSHLVSVSLAEATIQHALAERLAREPSGWQLAVGCISHALRALLLSSVRCG